MTNLEFKSEDVEVKMEKNPGCIVKLSVKASKNLVAKARKKAIKEVNKEFTTPGFRKGKAPEELVLKQHPENVEQKWQKAIADLSFVEAQNLIKTYPLNTSTTINFNMQSHSADGAELTFSFETEPEVPSVDPSLFKLKNIKVSPIEEAKLDETIRQAQFFYAKWTEVERPIKEGDFVILDLDSLNEAAPQRVFNSTRFEVKDKSIAQWMKKLLLGAKKADVVEGISKPDDDAPEAEKKKYEPRKVRITIKHVEEATLPELNDDFAKRIGAATVLEMRAKIKEMLEKQRDEGIEREKKEEVNRFLIDTYPFDLPGSLYKSETKYRKDQMLLDPKFKSNFDKMTPDEKKKFENEVEKSAKEAVMLFYLSRKIVHDAKIEVSQKEVHDEIIKTIQERTPPGQEPNFKHITEELYALCLSKIMMEKAQNFILNHSK